MWPLKVSTDGSQVWGHIRITQGTLDQILWEGGLGSGGGCRGVEGPAWVCYIILLGVAKFENYCPTWSFQSYIACELIRNVNYQALPWIWGFPAVSSGKVSSCQCRSLRRRRVNLWVDTIPWKRKWQPIPVFLPGKSHGQRGLAGYSQWDCQRVGHDLATKQQQKNQEGSYLSQNYYKVLVAWIQIFLPNPKHLFPYWTHRLFLVANTACFTLKRL